MDKFDADKAKLFGIVALMLFILIMLIANAYNYLPQEQNNIPNVNNEIIVPTDETETDAEPTNEEQQEEQDENPDQTAEQVSIPVSNEVPPLESFSENDTEETTQAEPAEETFETVFQNAKQLKNNKQLAKSIEEFQKACSITNNTNEKAQCYEEMSLIYAVAKKYGTALSFAQKAYNLAPSSSREMLLARLYYKTGATDKATDRINNILRRDFSQDN